MTRIPNANSPVEIRKAFQQVKSQGNIIREGALGEILIGVTVGVNPAWGTDLTTLTSLTVDNISIDGAVISSDSGAISFSNENLTTTGTVAGVNITSGNNPGHTHTDVHHGATTGLGDDDHTQYHNNTRGDVRYYTQTLLDGGQLDGQYFQESEFLNFSAGAGDSSKPIKLDVNGHIDASMINDADVDHGGLGGLDDDDHSLYSLVAGTRAFTGTVSGIDPTASSHLATKEYVDQSVQFVIDYFLNDTASDIGSYYKMQGEQTGEAESYITTGILTTGENQEIVAFVTEPGIPGVTVFKAGVYASHFHAEVLSGNKPVKIHYKIYKRLGVSPYTETLLGTSEETGFVTSSSSFSAHATMIEDVTVLIADRFVCKFFANIDATGNNVVIRFYMEGDNASRVTIPITTEVLSSIFLRQDGTEELIGNMSVASGITIDGRDISADGALLDAIAGGKVAVDTNATPDFLGNAFNDGTLRTSTGISFADGGDFITLTTNDGEIAHGSLSGYVANEHIDHSGVSISSGTGLTGGGAITSTQTLALDINGLSATGIAAGDFIPFWDITATATNKKITFANFEGTLNHNSLSGYVAAEHIDWTGSSDDFDTSGYMRTGAWTIEEVSNDTNRLGIQSQNAATYAIVDFYAKDGDGTDNVGLAIWGKGTPTDWSPWAWLSIKWNENAGEFSINTDGSSTSEQLNIYVGGYSGQVYLDNDGNTGIRNTNPTRTLDITGTLAVSSNCTFSGTGHDSFTDMVANEHIDHTDITLTAGSGIAGGGTIADNRTFDLDINSLAAASIASGDFVPFWDITATATNKKITFTNFEAALTHDNLIAGTIADHDTTATGANLTSLTDNSMVDALHRHSELSASDGTPDQALQVDAAGLVGIRMVPATTLDVRGRMRVSASSITAPASGRGFEFIYTTSSDDGRILVYDRDASAYKVFKIDGTIICLNAHSVQMGDTAYVGVRTLTPDCPFEVETITTEGRQAITIDQNDIDEAFIDFQGESAANADNSITTWTTGASIEGFVWVEINGVKKRMAYYDEPTS